MAKIKDAELQEVLAAVTADLEASYQAEKANLAKAEPEKLDEDASASPSATPESSDSDAAPMAPEAAPAPEAPPAGPEAEGVPGEQGGEAPLSVEALAAEYAQLPPEEFAMHAKAVEMAMQQMQGAGNPTPGADASAPASPPAAPPPAAASPSAPPMPPQAMKSEVPAAGGQVGGAVTAQGSSHEKANGGKTEGGKEMSKSETDPVVAELKALIKAQADELANVGKILEHMINKPVRKSVTSVADLAKNENQDVAPVTPAEAQKKLFNLIPTLSKSERQTVLDFYEGRASINSLKPILSKIQ